MVRIQGMRRDVTPAIGTALGAAGQAIQGAVGMRGELQRHDAQAQAMAQRDEQMQMQRVEFGLATEKLRLGIEEARASIERDKKLRSDQRAANVVSLQAMQRSGGYDALGPEVRAFHEEAIRRASEMEPEAGAKLVAASGAMIAKADNDVRRSSMLRTVMGSVSTGYWKQAESVLAEIAGIDIDGDGTEDVSSRKLSDIAEEWTKRLQDPTTDASEIEREYRELRRAVDGAIARQEQRLKVYNVLQQQFEEAFSPPPIMGNSAYQTAAMPEGLVAEAKALLEDWRIGEIGDGPGAEAEAKRSMRALINGNKFLPLPDGSPYGDGIEVPWSAWNKMQVRERANLMGVLTGNDVRLRALDMASDHVSKLLSTKTIDPEDAPDLLAYYTNWYSAALSDAPLPAPPKAAAQQSAATTPDAMLEDLRSNGTLDKLRQSMAGRSEDEKFQLLSAFIDSQSEDESVRSGLAQKLIMELLP